MPQAAQRQERRSALAGDEAASMTEVCLLGFEHVTATARDFWIPVHGSTPCAATATVEGREHEGWPKQDAEVTAADAGEAQEAFRLNPAAHVPLGVPKLEKATELMTLPASQLSGKTAVSEAVPHVAAKKSYDDEQQQVR